MSLRQNESVWRRQLRPQQSTVYRYPEVEEESYATRITHFSKRATFVEKRANIDLSKMESMYPDTKDKYIQIYHWGSC